MAATPQPAIFNPPGRHQWYVHLSRLGGYPAAGSGADSATGSAASDERLSPAALSSIRSALAQLRSDCANCPAGPINLVVGFGPSLLAELAEAGAAEDSATAGAAPALMPADFQPYATINSTDGSGKQAIGTQEELLLWLTHEQTDVTWKAQYDFRVAVSEHMFIARETPAFVLAPSLDMTGFTDGIGNPSNEEFGEVALVPADQPGAGGSHVIAQRWVHDLTGWNEMPVGEQEAIIGRKKYPDDSKLAQQAPQSHLRHVELRADGNHGMSGSGERDEMWRRSAPYALHDGTVGLYFVGFCGSQAPLRERMDLMYGIGVPDGVRDGLTDFSEPASGSYYFAPSEEALAAICSV